MNQIIPVSRCPMQVRAATMADIPFMDGLQKKFGKALGYFPTKQFEGYVESGGVLVAEATKDEGGRVKDELNSSSSSFISHPSSFLPLGYIISRDRYLKRDELGVIYQLGVTPGVQRKLVGAALVREVFARSAYGCRLYCCWCAQDLEANYFWEAAGFIPLAFRTGSDKKRRVHIFWQRRIGQGDVGQGGTPYWYPFQTNSGAIREDRLVFPIPPGVHWKDVRAVKLPEARGTGLQPVIADQRHGPAQRHGLKTRATNKPQKSKTANGPGPGKVGIVVSGRIKYIVRPGYVAPAEMAAPAETTALAETVLPKKARPKAASVKIDPKFLAAARELRDRYLEQFNSGLILPAGKYAVGRELAGPNGIDGIRINPQALPLLEAKDRAA